MKDYVRTRVIAVTLALVTLVMLTGEATARGHRDFDNTRPGSSQTLIIERGRSVMLKFNGLRRVAVVNPEVADVQVMSKSELLVMGLDIPPVRDQSHTMLYVWDKDGLHNFSLTVVGMPLAERIAQELQESISPNLSVQVVSDTMVVVEGEVADEEAKENLTSLLDAASTDDVNVVNMVETSEETRSEAEGAARTLNEILDPAVEVTAWGDNVVSVKGQLDSQQQVAEARKAITAVTEGLRVVDMLTYEGQATAERAPAEEIQELLGDQFTVTPLSGNAVAVDGTVEDARGLERVNRLLTAYPDVQTVNLVQVVPPSPDLDAARKAVSAAVPEGIEVSQVGQEGLMMEGSVPSEDKLEQLSDVVGMFEGRVPILNLVTVVEEMKRRVQVAVKVLELTRGADEDLGIDWGQYEGVPHDNATYRAQPFLFGQVPGVNGWPELYRFSTQVHALIDKQKARILSEPNLLVNEAEEADILIGGEIPVPIAQSNVGGAATVTVEWKPFGVNLTIKPTISPDDQRVKLEVSPEVSSLDFGNGVTVGGLSIPALRTRRANTIVSIPDGGVLAIGGLIQSDQSKTVSKIPILGDLPILGQLFRHDSFRNDESELIILVLPQILNEDGEPVHPIPVPDGVDRGDVMEFGTLPEDQVEAEDSPGKW